MKGTLRKERVHPLIDVQVVLPLAGGPLLELVKAEVTVLVEVRLVEDGVDDVGDARAALLEVLPHGRDEVVVLAVLPQQQRSHRGLRRLERAAKHLIELLPAQQAIAVDVVKLEQD